MSTPVNRQVLLARRPAGIPQAGDFRIVETAVPTPGAGQVRVRNLYLSVEPAMRGWVAAVANYSEPVPLGGVMRSFTAGVIDASNHPGYPVGTRVSGMFGWQDFAVADVSVIEQVIEVHDLPISTSLGVLGINGLTAHYGLLEIGQPKSGQTVVVSTAAGSVGSCVGQIAKLKGCRTVGIAGGAVKAQKCLDQFGYDAAVDYKSPTFAADIAAACVGGVDVYFDNTSGAISDEVMKHLKVGARIVICGTASVASWSPAPQGPRVERQMLVNRARMQGFVIFDHADHYPLARRELGDWIRAGQLRYEEDILEGIDAAPDAIAGLYRGENQGKRLIRIAAE